MMKKIALVILSLSTCVSAFSQLEGDWYGSIKRSNRASDILIHILKTSDSYTAVVDFPSENRKAVKPDRFTDHKTGFYLILEERQIAVKVKLDDTKESLVGEIVFNGKPTPIALKKNQTVPPPATTTSPQSNRGESGDPSMSPDIKTPAPIAHRQSLFIEELSWMEIRDAMQAGKTTVIIATGGIEQSGPYIPTGKHNFILRPVTQAIAEKLGNALVAPIVPFVPEGNHNPPTSHMKYPGSISLREETYESLLSDIAVSYLVEGFKNVVFIGDSGGNQWGMYKVATDLDEQWKKEDRRVLYIYEYYDNNRLSAWLKEQGIEEVNEGIHDNLKVTTQIMVVDPRLVHTQERIDAGKFSINGIALAPVEKSVALGKKIIDYQSSITVEAIAKRLKEK